MHARYRSPVGWLEMTASDRGLTGIHFLRGDGHVETESPTPFLISVIDQLDAYFAGSKAGFDVPLDLTAAQPFVQEVAGAMRTIPFGETWSYGRVARAIEAEGASQAVGNAVGDNPIPIVIPCHRVIRADGSLGGYSGPAGMKRRLLALEGVIIPEQTRLAL